MDAAGSTEIGAGEDGIFDVESEFPHDTKRRWTNRERILILGSRGISYRDRHLMNDLKSLMPHAKSDSKVDKKEKLVCLNEVAEMKNCSKCIYFEARKKKDLYVWFANIDRGPSAKFLVQNVHTSGELKLSGNCLKGSRPILSFEKLFDESPHYKLLKELFSQTFATPHHHPKSQPFVDHVINFSLEDGRVWLRNYQIVDETKQQLEEVGPRMVLQLVKIFDGSFGGAILYENPDYICPNTIRRQKKFASASKYEDKANAKVSLQERRQNEPDSYKSDPIFDAVYGNGSASGQQGASTDGVAAAITAEGRGAAVGHKTSEAEILKRKIEKVRKPKNKKKPKKSTEKKL